MVHQDAVHSCGGILNGGSDDHPFAGCQAIRFDHDRGPLLSDEVLGGVRVCEGLIGSCGDPVPLAEALCGSRNVSKTIAERCKMRLLCHKLVDTGALLQVHSEILDLISA